MVKIKNVPITIVETGETVLAIVEIHKVFERGIILNMILKSPLDCVYNISSEYHIQIGKHEIRAYAPLDRYHISKFIQSEPSFISVEAWEKILRDEACKTHFVKNTTTEEKLLEELNKYFKSDECTISYRDANRIEEIICDVLKGE